MRFPSKKWRWFGAILGLVLVAFLVIRTWVVPAVILSQIQARYNGKVIVKDWWFGLHSSGVSGVKLSESAGDDSPVWFSADRISTNVSISRMLRGRFMPTRIEVDQPKIVFRLDANGQPLTKIPVAPDSSNGQDPKARRDPTVLPDIVTKNGVISLEQEGRKPMTIAGIDARLAPVVDGGKLEVKTNDPTWGQVTIAGHFDPSFKNGQFEIDSSPGFVAEPSKLERIPFIPKEVWANLEPRGPVDAKVKINLAVDSPKPVSVHTELTLKGTTAKLNSLQVESQDTTGHVVIDDARVVIQDLNGKTLDGTISARGTLDFGSKIPRFDLDIRLKDIDVTKAPASWQLGEVGATGKLSGRVNLKVALRPSGPDLLGSAGRAVVEGGNLQGIPIKSFSLGMKAEGNDLQYETLPSGAVDKNNLDAALPNTPDIESATPPSTTRKGSPIRSEIWESVTSALPIIMMASNSQGLIGWIASGVSELVELQVKQTSGKGGGFRLPKTISTQMELEDVDLDKILEKAKKFGIELPFPVAGKFSIKASATIPLGSLRDLQGYVFRGDATLKQASIDHVDLGIVGAHLEFVNGVLELSDFRGTLVDKPSGSATNPPPPAPLPPIIGPLPPRSFRARLHAEIAPRGTATAKIEGNRLPLGELFAPVLPVPTPVSGDLTMEVQAKGDLSRLADPKSWTLDGRADSRRIKYQEAVLDGIATEIHVKDGRVDLKDLSATLSGHPLTISGGLDLSPPYHYSSKFSIESWQLSEILGFVPGIPRPSPASGAIDARGNATGALQPFEIQTRGGARILNAKGMGIDLGNVAFQWLTESDSISIRGVEIFAFGGKTTGEARIPTKPGKLLEATATLKGIDSSRLSAAFLGTGLKINGLADGQVKLTMPRDASVIDAEATLVAPELMVREGNKGEIAVKSLKVTANAQKGVLRYDASAESLGGRILFSGSTPIAGDFSKALAEAELRAAGFRLGEVWKGLGMVGGVSHLDGLGAIDANIRARLQPFQLFSRGIFELRDLRYGRMTALGNLSGIASLTPTTWRVDDLKGELVGGVASGEAHSETRPDGSKVVAFDFKVDRASLLRLASSVPRLARGIEGYGSLRIAGKVAEALRASSELLVPRAKILGIDLTDLRFPVELEMDPVSGSGTVHARQWTARMAGGSVRGTAWVRLGGDRSFQTETQLNGVDLGDLAKLQPGSKRAATGKVSGKVTLSGPDPEHLEKLRGRIEIDLDDASLVEIPIFKELDRFLGASRGGGLFEDGDLEGNISNRTLAIEQLTLKGKLIQIHALGTVTFDGNLNLEVLVNTNEVIPQSGLALVNLIPGLGQALGRGEEALMRVASFLENRLLKFRVTGTVSNPVVQLDPGVAVGDTAVGFFSSVLRVPVRSGR